MRILVIDDDPSVCRLLREVLEPEGHDVRTAHSGHEALRLHYERPFELVITDVFMPDGDGYELLMALRDRGDRVPVIAISGGSPGLRLSGLELAETLGARRTIRKPFRAAQIHDAVREVAGGSAATA